ncbi:MAG: alpha/beta hydrolase [Rhizobiaceae bacterium]|nr:alpha/beta hydrolase [Rhizobiaceae bacterium]
MNVFTVAFAIIAGLVLVLAGTTRIGAWLIEKRNPPVGSFATVRDTRLHYVHVPAENPTLPPVVFIHGASGNLLDQMLPIRKELEGTAEMLFLDRPGHGWSSRGADNATPDRQTHTIAALMDEVGIDKAIIVGHSFGGGVTASFALEHPDRTAGLVFVAAASHPWPGGGTSWYYDLTVMPVLGRIFSETLSLPAGWLRMAAATDCVFAPNPVPETYNKDAAIELVLRPSAFRSNAADVKSLFPHVSKVAPRYGEIDAPTVVISGDSDTVVYEEIHSMGLARDIPGAELIWIKNLGHKPDWTAPDIVAAAVAKVAGQAVDLSAAATAVETRIAGQAFGPVERCKDEKPPVAAQASG